LIQFFEARDDQIFDLYGRYWEKRKFRCYRGTVSGGMPGKNVVQKDYKFAIAYENSAIRGYITEKLWDCFATGVVPIYWGAPNITDYVPADCFIDRRHFASNEELLAYLQAMTREEWEGYVRRGREFLLTDKAQLFTFSHYARTLAEAVRTPLAK
jgi:alpha(1,3/1,4) fucosyltransferase